MSYPNQYPQQPPYGQPPQQQYGQPQMPQGLAQPGYGAPAGYPAQYGAPPPQGQYGAPPVQGQYGAPPAAGQYGAPPPAPYGAPQGHPAQPGYAPTYGAPPPAAGQYGAPPPAQYGAPAPQGQYGAPPPQGQYGAPQGYGGGGYAPVQVQLPRTYLGAFLHPSENPMLPQNEKAPSGQSVDGYNPSHDVEQIHKACKGFGTDEAKVTASIVPLSAAAIPPLIHAFKARHGTDLVKYLEKELGGNYEDVIVGVLRGPLGGDVHWLTKAMAGAGTNEKLVTELLISRPPSSLHLLRAAYQAATHRSLDQTVESELSFKTKQGFSVALMGDWKDSPGGDLAVGPAGGPVNEAMVKADVDQLKGAMRGIDDDEVLVASIIFARSPNHLNRLQALYLTTTRTPLTRKVKAHFTGHLQSALVYALEFAKKDTNGAWRDAKMIHKAMDGMGTDDKMLIIRILRAHWDRPRWKMVQQAYHHKYKVAMQTRVMKETSGDYRDGLLAILNLP